jgi:hypothetical protein
MLSASSALGVGTVKHYFSDGEDLDRLQALSSQDDIH